jgi:UDP-N-acetylmuramoylalanine--D-glutamate ligase
VLTGLVPSGLALFDAEDPRTPELCPRVPARVRVGLVAPGDASPADDSQQLAPLSILGPGPGHTLVVREGETYPRALLRLAGRHNSKNALFALAAARHLDVTRDACRAGLASFGGLPHRMEAIGEHAGILYYNDSKATNVASVLASLDGFERRFVLIAGGRLKGDDLRLLRPLLAARARGLVALGEAANALKDALKGALPCTHAATMAEALTRARELARAGDAIILSPACSSFDMYPSYRHRGDDFRTLVAAMIAASA